MKLPKSRTENIVVQQLRDEILTYDMLTHEAYCLNSTSAIVYGACDGVTTFEDLTRQHKYPADLIYLALDNLREKNLLADEYRSIFEGVSRREVIKKVGLASMIALPMISGLAAPKAAHAASAAVNCSADGEESPGNFISGADINQCLGTGYPEAACCSGTAYGEYFFGDCYTETCGTGPGCVGAGRTPDGQYIGNSTDPESCPSRTNECCSGTTSYNTFTGDPTSYDCFCGTQPPE